VYIDLNGGPKIALKTVTIDIKAYVRLNRQKCDCESLSQTIKRIVPKKIDADAWFAKRDRLGPPTKQFVQTLEEQIARRRL
jgi:hypothetical protein